MRLSILDVLIIGAVVGLLFLAARTEFVRYEGRTVPPAGTAAQRNGD